MEKDHGIFEFHRFYKGQGHIDERGKSAPARSNTAKRMRTIEKGRSGYTARYGYKPGYTRSLTKVRRKGKKLPA